MNTKTLSLTELEAAKRFASQNYLSTLRLFDRGACTDERLEEAMEAVFKATSDLHIAQQPVRS
jgi:hypothetical protein